MLTPGDAVNLLEALLAAQTHSYLLGLKLGLPVHVVDGIFATHFLPRDRLLHVLIAFLNQEEPQPTWEVVVGALRSPAVNLPQLAKAVEAKYSPYRPRIHDNIPTPTSIPAAGFYNNTRCSAILKLCVVRFFYYCRWNFNSETRDKHFCR